MTTYGENVAYELETIRVKLKVAQPRAEAVSSPSGALSTLRAIFRRLDDDQEHFVMLALDAKNRLRGFKVLASGAQSSSVVDLKIVFRNALLLGADAIIIAHNHPSNDPEPSMEDGNVTKEIAAAAKVLQVRLHDHIILAGRRWYSFREKGRINP